MLGCNYLLNKMVVSIIKMIQTDKFTTHILGKSNLLNKMIQTVIKNSLPDGWTHRSLAQANLPLIAKVVIKVITGVIKCFGLKIIPSRFFSSKFSCDLSTGCLVYHVIFITNNIILVYK
jgi:hypothetical protein